MGKPVAADLKLGLATAPVLFAADQVDFLFSVSKYVNIIVRILHQLNVLYEEHFECESVKLIDKDVVQTLVLMSDNVSDIQRVFHPLLICLVPNVRHAKLLHRCSF